jgi:hypothetical protein
MLEDYTVKPIQTVGTSHPKVAIRGLCKRCNHTRRAVLWTPRSMRKLRNGPIAGRRGGARAGCKREEKEDFQRSGP